jgi:hypothetical protein
MVTMENNVIAINAEILDGMVYLDLWNKDGKELSVRIQQGNIEGTRPLLDKLGEILGLTLEAKK